MKRTRKRLLMILCVMVIIATCAGCKKKIESITLSSSSKEIRVGDSFVLNAVILPNDYEEEVTWKSVDESIATVSQDGRVTGKTVGKTTIMLYSDSGKSASCEITVLQKTAYSRLSTRYKKFVDLFRQKALPTALDPSSVRIRELYCWELITYTDWAMKITGANAVGGTSTDNSFYNLNEGTGYFGVKLVQYDGWLDPYEKVDASTLALINEAIHEKR